jgi:CRISPR/Cas system-associated protein Csm6
MKGAAGGIVFAGFFQGDPLVYYIHNIDPM